MKSLPPATQKAKLVWDKNIKTYDSQRKELWGIVQQCTSSPELISFVVKNIIEPYKVPGNDPVAFAKAVQKFAQEKVKFFREMPERWQSPCRTILWGIGDCDDKTILISCILRSFRIPVKLVFVRYTKPNKYNLNIKKKQGHVFPCAYVGGKWTALESVRPVDFGFNPIDKLKQQGATIDNIECIGDKAE